MRAWVIVVVLLSVVACKGGKSGSKGKGVPPAATSSGPKVEVATVLAKDDKFPPYVFIVDDAGAVRIAAAKSWADLDANKLRIAKTAAPLDAMDRFTREQVGLGRGVGEEAVESIKRWDDSSSSDIDLAALEDVETKHLDQDDPPPPEEEDMPDDGEDESGGTGTAIALEEGKMGKRDSDRAEGQYKMKKTQDDPQLARQQAIEQARAAGILGGGSFTGDGFGPGPANEDGTPVRMAQATGAIVVDAPLEHLRAMVLVPPAFKATKLIEIVRETGAAIAVRHETKLRPLRLHFGLRDAAVGSRDWVEARVTAKGITVEAVPDKPIEVEDLKALGPALDEARKTRGTDASAPVDVLVDPDIDSQRLVDVIVALDLAGVRTIGVGAMPPAEELARRGHRIPTTSIGQPLAQGDLDKALIRRTVKSGLAKITACYTKALVDNPGLSGTVQVQFFISPDGKVASSTASGVDPALATCVAETIKALQFPKPRGGGGVQVSYPFTFRP